MGNFLKENGGVPLDHPRRCQAHNRSKHFGREGLPCRRYAAKGATVCTMHGGAAPQVKRKALLRRMVELDQQAQADAAFNVLLPPKFTPSLAVVVAAIARPQSRKRPLNRPPLRVSPIFHARNT